MWDYFQKLAFWIVIELAVGVASQSYPTSTPWWITETPYRTSTVDDGSTPPVYCTSYLTARETVQGYRYPMSYYQQEYRGHENKCIIIQSQGTNQVFITFQAFDLEYDDNCNFDFLQINDGNDDSNNTVLGRWCGTSIPAPFYSTGNSIYMWFRSDASVQKSGFNFTYQSVPTRDGCSYRNDHLGQGGVISNLRNSEQDLCWIVSSRNSSATVVMSIIKLNCNTTGEFIIYDGSFTVGGNPLYSARCPNFTSMALKLRSRQNSVYIKASGQTSFELHYVFQNERACNMTIIGPWSTRIRSPGYPRSAPDNLRTCEVFVAASGYSFLEVVVEILDLEGCSYDYLDLFNGYNATNGTLLDRLCSRYHQGQRLYTSGRAMLLQFNTDSSVRSDGYVLRIQATNKREEWTTTSPPYRWTTTRQWSNWNTWTSTWHSNWNNWNSWSTWHSNWNNWNTWSSWGSNWNSWNTWSNWESQWNQWSTPASRIYPPCQRLKINNSAEVGYMVMPSHTFNGYYNTFRKCWLIMAPKPDSIVKLKNVYFKSDYGNTRGCRSSYVELRDGNSENDSLIKRLCESELQSTEEYSGMEQYMFVGLTVEQETYSTRPNSFTLNFNYVTDKNEICHEIYPGKDENTIAWSSLGTPATIQCWRILPKTHTLYLTINVELHNVYGCDFNYVEVYEGPRRLTKLCDSHKHHMKIVNSEIHVRLVLDGTVVNPDIKITYWESKEPIPTWSIALIVLVSVIFVILVVTIPCLLIRHRKRRNSGQTTMTRNAIPAVSMATVSQPHMIAQPQVMGAQAPPLYTTLAPENAYTKALEADATKKTDSNENAYDNVAFNA